jgi:hypothetical protein
MSTLRERQREQGNASLDMDDRESTTVRLSALQCALSGPSCFAETESAQDAWRF